MLQVIHDNVALVDSEEQLMEVLQEIDNTLTTRYNMKIHEDKTK